MITKVVKMNKMNFFLANIRLFLMLETSASGKGPVFQTTSNVSKNL